MIAPTLAPAAPRLPLPTLSIGITGHRLANPVMAANAAAVEESLRALFGWISTQATPAADGSPPVRLHCLLNDGVDQQAAALAIACGWQLVAPLPFGHRLDCAINAMPDTPADAQALLAGDLPADPAVAECAARIRALSDKARLFELAEQDDAIAALHLARLTHPADQAATRAADFAISARVAMAGRVMVEQCDLLIAVWDGVSTSLTGGTGATIMQSLTLGTPVLWIDANAPQRRRLLFSPEALAHAGDARSDAQIGAVAAMPEPALGALIAAIMSGDRDADTGYAAGAEALATPHWHAHSPRLWHAYRRIEAMFGDTSWRTRFRRLRQGYALPGAAAADPMFGTDGAISALPGQEPGFSAGIADAIVRRFAWADGIAAYLSDTYRGGMVLNFLFSACAIVGGIAYLPLSAVKEKWLFSAFELSLLLAILVITIVGRRRRWHGRWFETRRVAEYLRHAPLLLAAGVARPGGRWPKGTRSNWPETYARRAIRSVGLPAAVISADYLRATITTLLLPYAQAQRAYHIDKAARLSRTQHNLDRLSEAMFMLAVLSVAVYLLAKLGGAVGWFSPEIAEMLSPRLSFLGVALPTFGAAIAGIRYFGDFERFAAISEVTAERLEQVISRLDLLAVTPAGALDYTRVAELTHAIDDIVVDEIESWQAVFAGKHVSVPV